MAKARKITKQETLAYSEITSQLGARAVAQRLEGNVNGAELARRDYDRALEKHRAQRRAGEITAEEQVEKVGQLRDKLMKSLERYRREVREEQENLEDKAKRLIDRARGNFPRPSGSGEWQEADARAGFIRDDLAKLAETEGPGAIAEKLADVASSGDEVEQFLTLREGRRVLEELDAPRALGKLNKAASRAWPSDKRMMLRGRLIERFVRQQERKLFAVRTPAEVENVRKRYGLGDTEEAKLERGLDNADTLSGFDLDDDEDDGPTLPRIEDMRT